MDSGSHAHIQVSHFHIFSQLLQFSLVLQGLPLSVQQPLYSEVVHLVGSGHVRQLSGFSSLPFFHQTSRPPQVGNYIQTLWNEIKSEEEGAEVGKNVKKQILIFSFSQCPCHLNGGVEAATTLAGALLSLLLRWQ